MEQGPLEMFWRQAIETSQITEAEATVLPLARDIARIVTLPLVYEGCARGVLLAGLPHGQNQQEAVERLERRALLAAQVLQQKARLAERERLENWRLALLESSEQPVLLLDRSGFLRAISRSAARILKRDAAARKVRWDKPELRFAELFRPREWESANRWLHSDAHAKETKEKAEVLRAHLKDGIEVECRRLDLPSEEYLVVSLEPAAATRERSREEIEEELRQTVNWMEEGVVLFDEAGGIRAANERFQRLMGLTAEETAEVKNFEDLVRLVAPHAQDPEPFAHSWRALGESPEGETQEELQMSWPVTQSIERCTREIVGENGRRLGRVEVYRERPRGACSSRAWRRRRSWLRWDNGSAALSTI